MPNKDSLKTQIIGWLKNQPFWFQFAGSKFLDGEVLSEDLANSVYKYFLEEEELIEIQGERPAITFVANEKNIQNKASDFALKEIREIKGVNALIPDQSIPISPNLTVIFGNNGAGKSSYVKLLNNVFKSRGDKLMLANVFSESGKVPISCSFAFTNTKEEKYLKFPEQSQSEEFSRYLVFDSHCAKVHLDSENSLIFTPSGFQFFNHAISLFDTLRDKLSADILKKKIANYFVSHFRNDNKIRNTVINLSASTDLKSIQELASFSDLEKNRLDNLIKCRSELLALKISDKIADLEKIQQYLKLFINEVEKVLTCFTQENINATNTLIENYSECYAIAQKSGIESLKSYSIGLLGNSKWKNFIVSAQQYKEELFAQSQNAKNDNCPFCLQPLQEKERQLINSYWQFLKSESEIELQKVTRQIETSIQKFQGFQPIIFDDSNVVYNFIKKKDFLLAEKWQNIIRQLNDNKLKQIKNLEERSNQWEIDILNESSNDFNGILESISLEIEKLKTQNPAAEIVALDKEILYLQDKQLFSDLKDKIISLAKDYKWAEKAEQSLNKVRTNAITIKQGELFVQHINDRYKEIFNRECISLKAPKVVEINQRNQKGQTLRRLQVAGNNALQILSEGEQRAISLADFLTEAQIDPNNRGIIFDDPVTSLDHERKDSIAKRLAQESLNRQVVIFTHDISFLVIIQSYADNIQNLEVRTTTIRRTADNVGLIQPNLPWIAQKVKDRIGWLKNDLVRLKKLEKEGADEYSLQVKAWYGLLREGWERAVEERLFKGVVERFAVGIQTQKLKKIQITDELIGQIEVGMTEASKWVHDSATGLNPPIPDTSKAEDDLTLLEDFAKQCISA